MFKYRKCVGRLPEIRCICEAHGRDRPALPLHHHRVVQPDAAVPMRELHRTTKSLCNGDKAMTVDIVDSDTRYIEPQFRDSAITVEDSDSGNERVMWRGQELHLTNPGFFTEALNPGSLKAWFQAIKKGIA